MPDYEPPRANIDPDSGKGWFRRLVPLLLAYRGWIAILVPAAALSSLTAVAIPWFAARAVDQALDQRAGPLEPTLWLLGGLAVAAGGLVWAQMYALRRLIQSLEYELRALLFEHLSRLSFSFFDRSQTGQLISRANADIRATLMFLTIAPMLGMATLGFAVALVLMVSVHPLLTLLSILTLPGVYFAGNRMRSVLFPISWVIQARMADIATLVEESVTGARVVKSFAGEATQIGLLARGAERLRQVALRQVSVRSRYGPMMENLPRVSRALVLLYGGSLAMAGEIPIATLLLFNAYMLRLQIPFRILAFALIMGQRAAASASRVYEILDTVPEIRSPPSPLAWEDPVGAVEFRHVTFGYDGGAPILEDLCLRLAPGETVALVGRTGCGKSTVARLLPRFYDVSGGSVLVDGHDVRAYSLSSLRSHIGLVLDEPFLFSESIRDNIAYGRPDAPTDEVVRAAVAAGADGFIEALDEGYDTIVGERGYTLSGGQRQRIAIARTLLVNPKILVLDDATSAIDVQLEHQIHAALHQLMRGRTTLIIAHRLSTIRLADRVALLENGRVVATGTHDDLMRTVPEYADILNRAEAESRAAVLAAEIRRERARTESEERGAQECAFEPPVGLGGIDA